MRTHAPFRSSLTDSNCSSFSGILMTRPRTAPLVPAPQAELVNSISRRVRYSGLSLPGFRTATTLAVDGPRSNRTGISPHLKRETLVRPHFSNWALDQLLAASALEEPVSRGPIWVVR